MFLAALSVYPLLQLVGMSLSESTISAGRVVWQFRGLIHLRPFLTDVVVPAAYRNTVVFVAVVVAAETTLGLALALAVKRTHHLTGWYRVIFMLPMLLPSIGIGVMWRLMYDFHYGIINRLLAAVRIAPQTWLADPGLALPSIMLVDIWHWTGYLFLIFSAAVASIPVELEEAARADGATEWQAFRHILLPLLRPTMIVAVMLRTIGAFKVFDEVYLLTQGGPGTRTQVVSLYIEQVFFQQFRMGYGAFLAVAAVVVAAAFVTISLRVLRRAEA
jgi:multiple sugar transport system permease protein